MYVMYMWGIYGVFAGFNAKNMPQLWRNLSLNLWINKWYNKTVYMFFLVETNSEGVHNLVTELIQNDFLLKYYKKKCY